VPVVITVPVVQTFPTQTLFDTCVSTPVSTTTPAPAPPPPPPPPKTSTVVSVVTASPTVVAAVTPTTLPNGSSAQTTVYVTSQIPPSTISLLVTQTTSSTITLQPSQGGSSGSGKSPSNIAPIAGGAAGGLVGLVAIIGLIWFILCVTTLTLIPSNWTVILTTLNCRRKRKSWGDIFDPDDDDGPVNFPPSRLTSDPGLRMSLDTGAGSVTDSRAYQYGLVGPALSPPFASPPGSPPTDYPQYIVPDDGRGYSPGHIRNLSSSSDQYIPEYNQHTRQYSTDHMVTQHGRRPSATSLMYSPLVLPNTGVSPQPSMTSAYSPRPGNSREPSNNSGSAPLINNPRDSTDGSGISRASAQNFNAMPMPMSQVHTGSTQRRTSQATDQNARPLSTGSVEGPASSRRTGSDQLVSPRMLTLTNWNQSTDAVSFDSAVGPSRSSPEQARGGHPVQSSMSSTGSIPANAPQGVPRPRAGSSVQAGPSNDVIMHTDGGAVRQDAPTSDDIKEIPTEAPPAYSG
jgi:hypothetical protein